MNKELITSSAALFYDSEPNDAVPLEWLARASKWFRQYELSPILFTAGGGEFELDDCYVLADAGGDLVKWGESIAARGPELIKALRLGIVDSLSLDAPRTSAATRSEWHADVLVSSLWGKIFLGIDADLVSEPVDLLRQACEMAKGLFDVRYGIAYRMPLVEEPDSYASGSAKSSLSDVFEMIRNRREWDSRKKTADELWTEELTGERRHLGGLFRGAYSANVLSEAHLQAADLRSQGVGKLSQLDSSRWFWELPESEIAKAQEILEAKEVLVSQAAQR